MKKLFSEISLIQGNRLTLRAIAQQDADALAKLVACERVYRYLPTFLFERKYKDIRYVIAHLYDECLKESIWWIIFTMKRILKSLPPAQ